MTVDIPPNIPLVSLEDGVLVWHPQALVSPVLQIVVSCFCMCAGSAVLIFVVVTGVARIRQVIAEQEDKNHRKRLREDWLDARDTYYDSGGRRRFQSFRSWSRNR